MSTKARELAELSRTIIDTSDATAITINANEEVTLADDLFLADGKKAIFGADSDLEIYHSGIASHVKETGTGNLKIEGTNIELNNGAGNKTYLLAVDGGAVQLRYDDATRLTTTSSGVDISGTLSATGVLTVIDGSTSAPSISNAGDSNSGIYFPADDELGFLVGGSRKVHITSSGVAFENGDLTVSGTLNGITTTRSVSGNRWGVLPEVASNGVMEIGRYLDFHTTDGDTSDYGARFDYDGSKMILTSAFETQSTIKSSANISIEAASGNPQLLVKTAGAGNNPNIRIQADSNYWDIQTLFSNADDELDFRYNGSSKLIIDKDGKVGVGSVLHSWTAFDGVAQIGRTGAIANYDGGSGNANQQTLVASNTYYGSGGYTAIEGAANAAYMNIASGQILFAAAPAVSAGSAQTFTRTVTIDTSGKVGIGAISPTANLTITDENAGQATIQARNFATSATGSFVNQHAYEFRAATSTTTHGMLVALHENHATRRTLEVADSTGIFATFVNGRLGLGTQSPDTLLDVEHTNSSHLQGIHITNQQTGGYGSAIRFNSRRSDGGQSVEEAAQIRVQGENSWNSDGTTSSNFVFSTVHNNSLAQCATLSRAGGLQLSPLLNGYNFRAFGHDTDSFFGVRTDNNHSILLQADRSDGFTVFLFNGHTGALTISGALSKGSGSFKIDHPLPEKKDTHHLVHSFIEGPQADLIYRGAVDLVNGTATINIDEVSGMTEGTFVLLNTNVQCFTSNESGWTAIKGSVSGNILTITAQDDSCTDTISWMVVGERQDQHMKETEWTDDDGKVIVEPSKENN